MLSVQDFINKNLRQGAAQPHVYPKDIAEIKIPLPSLSEQKDILEKLDATFAEIDALKTNLGAKTYMIDELLRVIYDNAFANFGGIASYEPIQELAEINYGYTAKSSASEAGPHYLRITDIQQGIVEWGNVPRCKISAHEKRRFQLEKGDIVFARTGATTGKSYLVRDEVDSVFASYLIRVKPNKNQIVPELLAYFFQTTDYWSLIGTGISGSAQGGFNASKLADLKIKFPSDLKDQRQIVSQLDKASGAVRDLYSQNIRAQEANISLRRAILSSAFNGASDVA
jgi:type I restriction enzyme S subunit